MIKNTIIKKGFNKGLLGFRKHSSFFRMLPTFMICGFPRCGTASLFNYLNEHPQIISSTWKEINYFDDNYNLELKTI